MIIDYVEIINGALVTMNKTLHSVGSQLTLDHICPQCTFFHAMTTDN